MCYNSYTLPGILSRGNRLVTDTSECVVGTLLVDQCKEMENIGGQNDSWSRTACLGGDLYPEVHDKRPFFGRLDSVGGYTIPFPPSSYFSCIGRRGTGGVYVDHLVRPALLL